jgi:hypothetical protein
MTIEEKVTKILQKSNAKTERGYASLASRIIKLVKTYKEEKDSAYQRRVSVFETGTKTTKPAVVTQNDSIKMSEA